MSDKAGKESQYTVSHPKLGLDPLIGSDRETGRDIHYIARSVLRLIGDDHHIATHDEEPSTSNLLRHPL